MLLFISRLAHSEQRLSIDKTGVAQHLGLSSAIDEYEKYQNHVGE